MTRKIPHEKNDSPTNKGYIISIVILICVVMVGFFILIGSYGYFDKAVKEHYSAYQKDLAEKQIEIADLEKSVIDYDSLLNICITEVDTLKNSSIDTNQYMWNCVSYMCESPCTNQIEQMVTYQICEDILVGNGNLYD